MTEKKENSLASINLINPELIEIENNLWKEYFASLQVYNIIQKEYSNLLSENSDIIPIIEEFFQKYRSLKFTQDTYKDTLETLKSQNPIENNIPDQANQDDQKPNSKDILPESILEVHKKDRKDFYIELNRLIKELTLEQKDKIRKTFNEL
jgi:hypothetical protein